MEWKGNLLSRKGGEGSKMTHTKQKAQYRATRKKLESIASLEVEIRDTQISHEFSRLSYLQGLSKFIQLLWSIWHDQCDDPDIFHTFIIDKTFFAF